MHKKKRRCFFAALAMAILAACSAAGHPLKDGYYSAEAADFDVFGWKEYITIFVSSGRVMLVEYDAFNASGFVRSWDLNYMRGMDIARGIYPNAYARYYGERLLSQQGLSDINHVSGATHSYHIFMKLAETVLENARQGNAETSLVGFEADPHYSH